MPAKCQCDPKSDANAMSLGAILCGRYQKESFWRGGSRRTLLRREAFGLASAMLKQCQHNAKSMPT
eukprot:2180069-Pyramimonas_sp.AAC.1